MEEAYAKEEIHPGDLKNCVSDAINKLLAPILKTFEDPVLMELAEKAYPPPAKPAKKESKKEGKKKPAA